MRVCACVCTHSEHIHKKKMQQSEKYATQHRKFYEINGTHRWADNL